MDSSDSEDDCYGNVAQKLQRLKNKYTEDKIESTNLLNESAELDEIVKKGLGRNAKTNSQIKECVEQNLVQDSDEIAIDNLIASSSKRVTRSAAKRNSLNKSVVEITEPPLFTLGNSATNETGNASNGSMLMLTTLNTRPNRGTRGNRSRKRGNARGAGRGRRAGSPGLFSDPFIAPSNRMNPHIPTYSVGNTDEYFDQSDSQALFSKKPKLDEVVLIDENEPEENEELSVKVYWQSSEFFKFTIRRFQKVRQIFDYFSRKESVSYNKLFFTFNDKVLKPDDTPDSINYSIVKFIDGGIVKQNVFNLVSDNSEDSINNGIKLKFQYQNSKKPYELTVCLDEKLSIAMMKCAEYLESSVDKLRFEFDGDVLSGKNTARELELEGGECIDVRIKS